MFDEIVNDSFDTALMLKRNGNFELESMTSEEVAERMLSIMRESKRIEEANK